MTENKPLASIRGFAALWVVGHHWLVNSQQAWIQTAFVPGYKAVDIFFVLSGLILTLVYHDLKWSSAPQFMVRRIFRVYPLHIATLLALAVAGSYPAFHLGGLFTAGFAGSLLLLQPFIHLNASANPAAWSIGVELLCYLLFPLVLAGLVRLNRGRFSLFLLLGLACLFAAAQCRVEQTYLGDVFGKGAILRGLSGFGFGMCLAQLTKFINLRFIAATAGEALSCLAIVWAIATHREVWIPTIAALLLFCLSFDVGALALLLRRRVCLWLGHISFSIYLIHYPLIVAADRIPGFEAMAHGELRFKLMRYAVLLLALFIVATLSYRYLEEPCRKIPSRLFTRKKQANNELPLAESGAN